MTDVSYPLSYLEKGEREIVRERERKRERGRERERKRCGANKYTYTLSLTDLNEYWN